MQHLKKYFKPLKSDVYLDKSRWETTQIGSQLEIHTKDYFPDIKFSEIAVFNFPEYVGSKNFPSDSACIIRPIFYGFHFKKLPRISDLGSMMLMSSRKESFKNLQNICEELLNNGIIPLIIGGGHDLSYAIYKAYGSLEKFVNITSVDSKFDIGLADDNLASYSHLGKIISHKPSFLFHYTNLGYQSYFNSIIAAEMLESMHFDAIRLGELKANFFDVEPIMRNTDFLSFDISSIKYCFASANAYSTPNGIDGEEACKIMRYAGLSDKISSVGLFEYSQDLDVNHQTAYLLAEMMWYFIDGYKQRKHELNPNLSDCTKYTVAFEDGKNEITFYKSNRSGRWWIGVPFKKESDPNYNNYFVACSYRDYEIASRGEIPERWIRTLNKLIS